MIRTDGTLRLFTAIQPDDGSRHHLSSVADTFRSHALSGRFVSPENLHLTLNFIGAVKPEELSAIAAALESATEACQSFRLDLGRPGYFRRGRYLLLWHGLDGLPLELLGLQQKLAQALRFLGLPAEKRPYQPHFTLARDVFLDDDFDAIVAGLPLAPAGFMASRLVLFNSSLLHGCQIYSPLREFTLRDAAGSRMLQEI